MATVIEPKVDSNGKNLPWDPANIPASKPFINICTTACDSVMSFDDMNFVKTQSSIYSPFHNSARTINFDIGYSKEAKWFETLNNKWNEYTSFLIGEFLEEMYSTNKNNKTNAEII